MSKVKMESVDLDYETPAMRIHKKEKQIRANRRIESRERKKKRIELVQTIPYCSSMSVCDTKPTGEFDWITTTMTVYRPIMDDEESDDECFFGRYRRYTRTYTFKQYRKKEIAPYIRYFSRSRKRYEKTGNKRVRSSKELYQRGAYKKVYDLWWEYD